MALRSADLQIQNYVAPRFRDEKLSTVDDLEAEAAAMHVRAETRSGAWRHRSNLGSPSCRANPTAEVAASSAALIVILPAPQTAFV